MDTTRFHSAFARIGLMSFGGPAAQIALMHRVLVDEEKILTERDFSAALSFCMILPGPEAMQLATYAGWRLRGIRGGLIAGLWFIVPGALVIFALATLYISYGAQSWAQTVFLGIKAAVITIVVQAFWKLSRRALTGWPGALIAAVAFIGLFALSLPYPLILAIAALAGALLFSHETSAPPRTAAPPPPQTLRLIAVGLPLWLAPLGLSLLLGASFYTQLASYFAQLALLSFGGAYALLGWMTQTVVQDHGWITTAQMIDALGLAETTPGPLILVTQFVGHLAGHGQGGLTGALLAGLMVLWMVFTPCFFYIFIGAPYLERLMAMPRLAAALKGITAAVTGVIASLALWFALAVLWTGSALDPAALALVVTGAALAWATRGNLLVLVLGNGLIAWLLGLLALI
ncbi:chromate efflux transporter [Rhodobacteraceae bacterium 63075]|nr:chromate efflux transporter [Rhodobacteraceae bacterium 63075]